MKGSWLVLNPLLFLQPKQLYIAAFHVGFPCKISLIQKRILVFNKSWETINLGVFLHFFHVSLVLTVY